ncbi:MAG: hypothetical protein COS99_04800 [Candidatus Omnitrophica bacterium CG07_land_8_20_14_0_80_42_15]|uniref:Glycosyltransferase 2-like domain-containing protein n=1 Tax=Candidatus Aquitaenariimonas noxiae TaxID=1974741 RepID=A0A2J0KT30_9BACT|nr:MAG: hypothetical protein COS99_04800 [Candidatus Omnitrophica bacterium CG07_land_8_20_14_0_80_42_15]
MNSIVVSAIIPTFNRKKYLKKALDALLAQTYPHNKYGIVVVDDYSTDGTKELVEDIAKKSDVKIYYYVNDKAKGQAMVRNIAFQKAYGEFVASTDDDMTVKEDWIEKGLSHFTSSDILAVEGHTVSEDTKNLPFYHNMSMAGGTYGTGNIFYRKSILDKTGGLDEKLNYWHNYGSHYELGIRILEGEGKIVYGSDVVAYHPSFKMKAWSVVKNALKSGAIPYLYKKHGAKITSYLGFRIHRILISLLLLFFVFSILSLNYLSMIATLFSIIFIFVVTVPGFVKSGIRTQLKTLIIYSISHFLATLAFLHSCARHKIFPNIKMLRL